MGFGGVSNFIQNNKQVAFVAGKSIFLLDKKDGKVILEKNTMLVNFFLPKIIIL